MITSVRSFIYHDDNQDMHAKLNVFIWENDLLFWGNSLSSANYCTKEALGTLANIYQVSIGFFKKKE